MKSSEDQLLNVNIDFISVNPNQPRREFSELELEELSASILSIGIIHPPLVRKLNKNFYELISGERRLRAAKRAGFSTIPVIVTNQNSTFSAEASLIENIQRVDLNPIEIAQALERLQEHFGLKQEDLALKIGKKRSTVSNYLRLLLLPQTIKDSLSTGKISMGHAKAILSLSSPFQQNVLHEIILRDSLSVRETEKKAHTMGITKKMEKGRKLVEINPHWETLINNIQNRLGTKVSIKKQKDDEGQLIIDYYSLDDLNRLLELMGII